MTSGDDRMRETYPVEGDVYRYRLEERDGRFTFRLDGDATENESATVTLGIESLYDPSSSGAGLGWGEGLCRDETGRTHSFAWAWVGLELHLWLDGALHLFQRAEPATGLARPRGVAAAGASGDILAPMPGAVLQVLVAEGDQVERNQTVMVMESMKMELLIGAPRDGVVRRVSVQPGQQVDRGMRLLELAPESEDGGDSL